MAPPMRSHSPNGIAWVVFLTVLVLAIAATALLLPARGSARGRSARQNHPEEDTGSSPRSGSNTKTAHLSHALAILTKASDEQRQGASLPPYRDLEGVRDERDVKPTIQAVKSTNDASLVDYPDNISGRFGPFDAALDNQAPNEEWATGVAQAMAAEYSAVAGVAIEETKCGTTLCRVTISMTESDRDSGRVMDGLSRVRVFEAELVTDTSRPPAPPKMIIYFSKKGLQLPSPR